MNKKRFLPLIWTLLAALLCLSGCTDMSNRNPVVTFNLDPDASSHVGGTFKIELFPDKAPNSVNFIIQLLTEKDQYGETYYEKLNVSQVRSGSMVVFGDLGQKLNDKVIKGEFAENGFEGNDVSFVRGTVGLMLNEGDPDSNYGDFFIVLSDEAQEELNGKFCAVGRVIEGLELIDEISLAKFYPTNYQPVYSIRILTATVELKGRSYPKAETQERIIYPGYHY
jgi:cyclophilin family peptidyl-prolyl cis-trans isomerase